MTARLSSLSTRAQVALVAGGLVLVALIVYFAAISPKRSTAAQLKQQTAAVQAQIEQNRSTAFTQALPAVRAASVFRLSKAMPTELETPNVILQLNQLAVYSGISFDQITPEGDLDRHGHDDRLAGPVRGRADPGQVHGELLQPPCLPPAAAESGSGRERTPERERTAIRRERHRLRRGAEGIPADPGDADRQRVRTADRPAGLRRAGKHGHDVDLDHRDDDHPDDHHDLESHEREPEHERRNVMSRHKKRLQDIRAAKDRRAKTMAIGGAVLLVAILAFELPHYLGGSKGSATAAATHDERNRRLDDPGRSEHARGDCLGHRRHGRTRDGEHEASELRRRSEPDEVTAVLLRHVRRKGPVRPADRYADGFVQLVADGYWRPDHVGAGPDHGHHVRAADVVHVRWPAPASPRSR